MNLSPCQSCNTDYRRDKLKQCPSCGAVNDSIGLKHSSESSSSQPIVNKSFSSETSVEASDIERLIEAQDRTTHAVRAFVRFLFIQLSGLTAAYVVWNWSMSFVDQQKCYSNGTNCGGNTFLQIFAISIWIVSVFLSSRAGWSELKKSEV